MLLLRADMKIDNQYNPDIVFHPASTLKEKLEEMGMSTHEFALKTGMPEDTILAILKEESSVTSEVAILFENITEIPAKFWINRQARYDNI